MMTAKHEEEHPVPILKHGANRRQYNRRRYRLVWTPLNVTILIILAIVIGALLGFAIYRASWGTLSDYVCDSFVHLAVC